MRILLLTDNYPPESCPPAVRCSEHAARWVATGHAVTIVTSFPNFPDGRVFGGYRQSLFLREEVDGVDIIRVPTLVFANRGTVLRILDFLSFMVTATIAALCAQRPDVVIATSPQFFTAVAGWLVSALRGLPFVFEIRDLWPDSIVAVGAMREGPVIRILRRLESFLYRKAKLIVTVTTAFRDVLVARGNPGEKIVVVTNGIDLDSFSPGKPPLELAARLRLRDKIVVSYIGTVGMAHGLRQILDAAEECCSRLPHVHFLVVGTGAELNELKQLAADKGLLNLTFLGRVPHEEILDLWRLSNMTLVLLKDVPLFRTVIPSKVFEAMATGTPIVTNVHGELQKILEPSGAAHMIAPDSVPALVDAIELLANDPERRRVLAEAGLSAVKNYDRRRLADRMMMLLDGIVTNRGTDRPRGSSTHHSHAAMR